MRVVLAFSSFFRLLFGARLHPSAANYLPAAEPKKLAPPDDDGDGVEKDDVEKDVEAKPKPEPTPAKRSPSRAQHHRDGALAMLALLQREGRLIDFLKESIDDYDDGDIGAAVRDIHRGCQKVLDDFLTMEPVMPGDEDDDIKVPAGFDPHEVRLVGEVEGEPPFKGVLRHHGWRVTKAELPTLTEGIDRNVIAPAEVEIGS